MAKVSSAKKKCSHLKPNKTQTRSKLEKKQNKITILSIATTRWRQRFSKHKNIFSPKSKIESPLISGRKIYLFYHTQSLEYSHQYQLLMQLMMMMTADDAIFGEIELIIAAAAATRCLRRSSRQVSSANTSHMV